MVYGNDYIELQRTSSGIYSTVVNTIFTAGGVSDTWGITTKAEPVTGSSTHDQLFLKK